MLRRSVIVLALCGLFTLVTGCSSSRDPVMPGTDQIPLKVWVVLGPQESIGGSGNKGSRLSESEIQAFVDQLNSNADALFGPNVTFVWDPSNPTIARDNSLLPFQARERTFNEFIDNVIFDQDAWEVDHLNIYFVGNVQLVPNATNLAGTEDPYDANQDDVSPFILVNDGGFNQGIGFQTQPQQVRDWHILEHEMTHYLARFRNETINGHTYDAMEHVGNNANNILTPDVPPSHPLVIPGAYNQAGTEKKEIFDRIHAGNWNNP